MKNKEIDLNEYYKGNHATAFLGQAINLFNKSELNERESIFDKSKLRKDSYREPTLRKCMDDYNDFIEGKDPEKLLQKIKEKNIEKIGAYDLPSSDLRHEILRYFQTKITMELEEFHLLIVRLSIALELSLKGIALHKGFNIFLDKKELVKYDSVNIRAERTYELTFFVERLTQLLEPDDVEEYRDTFKFFRDKRNEYVHFSRKQNTYLDWLKILNHFCLLEKYFNKIIKPLYYDKVLLKEVSNKK